jgi:peptide/nickel transport system permease protein
MAPVPSKLVVGALRGALLLAVLLVILVPACFAPYAPDELDVPYSAPSRAHLLGTDAVGSDNLAVLVYATGTSLFVGLVTATIATLVGGMLGMVAGYHRGRFESVIMAVTDLFLLIPALPLLTLLAAYSNPGPWGLVLILSLTSWPSTARVVRAAVLPLGDIGFVGSARGLGASSLYITTRHILPHVNGVIMGKALTVAAGAMAAEGGITFLGLADPRTMSWGAMIHDAFTGGAFVNGAYWWYVPPVLAISIVVLALTLLGRRIGEPKYPNLFADLMARREPRASPAPSPQDGVLSIKNLTVRLTPFAEGPEHTALDDVSVRVREGERLAIIGQTGGGKSILLTTVLRLLPKETTLAGDVRFREKDVLALADREIARFRAKDVAYVPQEAANSFDPLVRVGRQIIEAAVVHAGIKRKEAEAQAVSLLRRLGATEPERWMRTYPHRLSGGMTQRALVAAALMSDAPLVLMDEPTKGLDDESNNAVTEELLKHAEQSFVVVTHDLSLIERFATTVVVIHASRIVEQCSCDAFFESPLHPYSIALLGSLTDAGMVSPEGVNDMAAEWDDAQCPFRPWCGDARPACREVPPMMDMAGRRVRCWKHVA